jgi:concentrative nucleoside transporter, CNT family
MADIARALFAIACLCALAFLCSEDRRRIPWRVVVGGLLLEIALALLLIHFPPARQIVSLANDAAHAVQTATDAGSGFVFGYLGGGPAPFDIRAPAASFIIAFKALPMVLTISALASLLYYWGVLQRVTALFALLLKHSMGVSGPLALGAAVHIFVGMVEAPLLIRPYLKNLQRGELFALMSCGLAGVAGTVMVIYASFLAPVLPDALGHILIASVISTPAALAVSALMVPWSAESDDDARLALENPPLSWIDAIIKGVADGVGPLVGIVSLLLTTIALVALVNMALGALPFIDGQPISLQRLFALFFRPLTWLIGAPWSETQTAAELMATKTVINEFVAFSHMGALPPDALSPKSRLVLTYALCGFANFGSMGILVGGLNAMVPERRAEIVDLGLRSIVSGTLATLLSATVAGVLQPLG